MAARGMIHGRSCYGPWPLFGAVHMGLWRSVRGMQLDFPLSMEQPSRSLHGWLLRRGGRLMEGPSTWLVNLGGGWWGHRWGRDESKRRRAESQWIVAARPLCHLQYPVAYLSRLQRILPAARREFLQGVPRGSSAAGVSPTTRAFVGRGPYCWSASGRRAHASLLARILT